MIRATVHAVAGEYPHITLNGTHTCSSHSSTSQMAAHGPNPARRPYLLGPLSTPIYIEIHRKMVIIWPPTSTFKLSLALCGPQGKIIENPCHSGTALYET